MTRMAFRQALPWVPSPGYARIEKEVQEGVTSVAVALDSRRSSRLAINAPLRASRMSDEFLESVVQLLNDAAKELHHLLL